VKHEYDTWDKEQTKLKTCNSAAKVFVNIHQKPQEVISNEDIVFTYDVNFQVNFLELR
jgi:transmembrane 9 superfamily protein 2/4